MLADLQVDIGLAEPFPKFGFTTEPMSKPRLQCGSSLLVQIMEKIFCWRSGLPSVQSLFLDVLAQLIVCIFGYYALACSMVTPAIMSWLVFTVFNLMTSFYSLWLSTDILSFVICGIFPCTGFNDSLVSNINKIYTVL